MTFADGIDIEFADIPPSSETRLEDIYRCLLTLYGSRTGQQALDKDFGLDLDALDEGTETAQALFTAELVRKTAKYEKRAKVKKVEYRADQNGNFRPKVVIELV